MAEQYENGEEGGPAELEARLGIKENRLRELYEELAAARLAADESRAVREAGEERVRQLEEDRDRLGERVRELEGEKRERQRGREGLERRIAHLEREVERRDEEISHRDELLEGKEQEREVLSRETSGQLSRKDEAHEEALRRVEGLERDLEEKEEEVAGLQSTIEDLRRELEEERELRRRLSEPANLLRTGIELFNGSEQLDAVRSLSRSLGRPEVHAALGEGEEDGLMVLSFTWQEVSWQTYAVNPAPAVEEPRIYLKSSGEDLSGVDHQPPNARIGPGERVFLGL